IRQQKLQAAFAVLPSVQMMNQINRGTNSEAIELSAIARPSNASVQTSNHCRFPGPCLCLCTYNQVASNSRLISNPSLWPLPASSISTSGFQAYRNVPSRRRIGATLLRIAQSKTQLMKCESRATPLNSKSVAVGLLLIPASEDERNNQSGP